MPTLRMSVSDRRHVLTNDMDARLRHLLRLDEQVRADAAKKATAVTRKAFEATREVIEPRRKRESGKNGGRMVSHLEWKSGSSRTFSGVRFDIGKADAEARHWIIQELGTGQRGVIRQANKANPTGRPAKDATYVRTVKSQKGRRISGGLVFATGGKWSPPGSRRDEQLHWASKVTGVPQWRGKKGTKYPKGERPGGQAAAIRIRNEIRGQHFVKKGGEEGFRQYNHDLLAAARQAFERGRP